MIRPTDPPMWGVGQTVEAVERALILDTLDHCHGNRTHAANILGISIRTLRNKLHLYADQGVAVPPPAGEVYRTSGAQRSADLGSGA